MTKQEYYIHQLNTKNKPINTVGYIYDMVFNLKFMAQKANEPLLSFLLEIVEKESVFLLKNYKNKKINVMAPTKSGHQNDGVLFLQGQAQAQQGKPLVKIKC